MTTATASKKKKKSDELQEMINLVYVLEDLFGPGIQEAPPEVLPPEVARAREGAMTAVALPRTGEETSPLSESATAALSKAIDEQPPEIGELHPLARLPVAIGRGSADLFKQLAALLGGAPVVPTAKAQTQPQKRKRPTEPESPGRIPPRRIIPAEKIDPALTQKRPLEKTLRVRTEPGPQKPAWLQALEREVGRKQAGAGKEGGREAPETAAGPSTLEQVAKILIPVLGVGGFLAAAVHAQQAGRGEKVGPAAQRIVQALQQQQLMKQELAMEQDKEKRIAQQEERDYTMDTAQLLMRAGLQEPALNLLKQMDPRLKDVEIEKTAAGTLDPAQYLQFGRTVFRDASPEFQEEYIRGFYQLVGKPVPEGIELVNQAPEAEKISAAMDATLLEDGVDVGEQVGFFKGENRTLLAERGQQKVQLAEKTADKAAQQEIRRNLEKDIGIIQKAVDAGILDEKQAKPYFDAIKPRINAVTAQIGDEPAEKSAPKRQFTDEEIASWLQSRASDVSGMTREELERRLRAKGWNPSGPITQRVMDQIYGSP